MNDYDPGTIEHYGTNIGRVEYRICGLNSLAGFEHFKPGAGLLRGRIVSSLFNRRVGGTVLVCKNGERLPFSLFGLKDDGITATVVLDQVPINRS